MDDVDIILNIDHDDVLPDSNLIKVINQWVEDFYAEEYNSLHTVQDTKSGYSSSNPGNAINRINSFPHYSGVPVNPNHLQPQPAAESETKDEPKKGPFSVGFEAVRGFYSAVYTGSFRAFPIREFLSFVWTLDWYDPDRVQIFYSILGDAAFRIATLSQDDILNDTNNQTDECVFRPEPPSTTRPTVE